MNIDFQSIAKELKKIQEMNKEQREEYYKTLPNKINENFYHPDNLPIWLKRLTIVACYVDENPNIVEPDVDKYIQILENE